MLNIESKTATNGFDIEPRNYELYCLSIMSRVFFVLRFSLIFSFSEPCRLYFGPGFWDACSPDFYCECAMWCSFVLLIFFFWLVCLLVFCSCSPSVSLHIHLVSRSLFYITPHNFHDCIFFLNFKYVFSVLRSFDLNAP